MRPTLVRRRRRAMACLGVCMALTAAMAAYTLFLFWKAPPEDALLSQPEAVSLPTENLEESRPVRLEPVSVEGLDPELPAIALTIDDSVTSLTGEYCRVLEENGCAATFFTVGYLAEADPEGVAALARAGMEVGNHCYSHQQLVGLNREKISDQIRRAGEVFSEILGSPPLLMRPPYGRVNRDVLKASENPVVLWSLDLGDTGEAGEEELLERLLGVKDGEVVRVHDGIPLTLEVLEKGLPLLREAGFQVTTVSRLFALKGYGLYGGERYDGLPEIDN